MIRTSSYFFLLLFLILCVASFLPMHAQNLNQTNIDSSILAPKWMTTSLKSATYRNGDSIQRVMNIKDWSSFTRKSNQGLYYIHITPEGDSLFLYNWFAINDSARGGIAPYGYRVPSYQDFKELRDNKKLVLRTGFPSPNTGSVLLKSRKDLQDSINELNLRKLELEESLDSRKVQIHFLKKNINGATNEKEKDYLKSRIDKTDQEIRELKKELEHTIVLIEQKKTELKTQTPDANDDNRNGIKRGIDTLGVDIFYVGRPYFVSSDDNKVQKGLYGFWLSTSFIDAFKQTNVQNAMEMAVLGKYNKGRLDSSYTNANQGYPVICIQNMDEVLMISNFGYDRLLPREFSLFKDSIVNHVLLNEKRYRPDIAGSYNLILTAGLEFDKAGLNISSPFKYPADKQPYFKSGFVVGLDDVLLGWTKYPFYKSTPIPSKISLNLNISLQTTFEKYDDVGVRDKSNHFDVVSALQDLDDIKDILRLEVEKVDVNLNGENESRSFLNSVNVPGPSNAFLSVVPGLGFSKVKSKNKMPLWLFGIASGVVAAYSYKSRDDYYSSYINSSYTDLNSYEAANRYNKTLLVSSGVLVGLSVFDVTYTILQGRKNREKLRRSNINELLITNPIEVDVRKVDKK